MPGLKRLILGGVRSGKSRFAQELHQHQAITLIVTAYPSGQGMHKRIERHRSVRPKAWITIEEQHDIDDLSLDGQVVLVDCLTLWLANRLEHFQGDLELTLTDVIQKLERFIKKDFQSLTLIANELGLGVHPPTQLGRDFADLQGEVNQWLAKRCERVDLLTAGIPRQLKG